jgi:hypothetical protein
MKELYFLDPDVPIHLMTRPTRGLRRHQTEQKKWRRLKFDMWDHGIPPRDYDPKLADYYENIASEQNLYTQDRDLYNRLWPYRHVCDCFHDKVIQGKAKNHAVHSGYGRGCRQAYDREYWGGERLRVRLELMNWKDGNNDPEPSIPKHSSRWNCD